RVFQMLDRDDMAAVERSEEADAGIDRFIGRFAAVKPADQYGTGTAVALGAAFLRAGEAAFQPEKIEQRSGCPRICEGNRPVIQQEADLVARRAHGGSASPIGRIAIG